MMESFAIKKQIIAAALLIGYMGGATNSFAQSTPTELADLSLEALLDYDVSEGDSDYKKKTWRFEYSHHKLDIGGYREGTKDISFDDILFIPGAMRTMENYPVIPTYITQEVHGFSGSYALNSKLTFSVLLPYVQQETDHISSVPGFDNFVLKTEGIGDIGLNVSHTSKIGKTKSLKISAGLRLPTGSINKRGDTPRHGMGTIERLPYTMQIGSGTLDATLAAHYVCTESVLIYGMSANATVRSGSNNNDYRLGNSARFGLWGQYTKNHWIQPGARVNIRHISEIKGRDESLLLPVMFPFPAPITDPSHYGGEKAGIVLSLKTCPSRSCDISFTAEYGLPIYQNLNGIQPKEKSNFSIKAALKF